MRGFSGDFESKIQNAREELLDIVQKLEIVHGKKRDFYLALLNGFKERLTVLARPETPVQQKTVVVFSEEFKRALLQFPA